MAPAAFATDNLHVSDHSGHIGLTLDLDGGCRVGSLTVDGVEVLAGSGVRTGVRTRGGAYTSGAVKSAPRVSRRGDVLTVDSIVYGDGALAYTESWRFEPCGDAIVWTIASNTGTALARVEDRFVPQWDFAAMDTWKGGILDNGGMVWCKYLRSEDDTYGVHTGGITLWNPERPGALRIETSTGGVMHQKFSHGKDGVFTIKHIPASGPLQMRYDLSRCVGGREDVFAPYIVEGGDTVTVRLSYVDYPEAYSRGNLRGIDAESVRELMNTTGRYGVVDNGIVGANGWTTNWKCLHEPFFAQIGLALADTNYTRNLAESLHQEAMHAVTPQGRVLSRWHNADEDQMPGTYNYQTGYYEARWGYTVDSQTGYVINVTELFDLLGSTEWLAGQKETCERALDWLLARDENGNGLCEMMNRNHREGTASDWLDIVWASYENAFVNAQLYEALRQWAACETVLGDTARAQMYDRAADRLKEAFNRPVEQGGFWSEEKGQYVYWLDDDGSVHGDNMVTPVNFAAISFGICDDPARKARVLDEIERRTASEGLFHWPLCFDSYTREEVEGGNWPFPRYENGDIFPTWGYLGVRSYAGYKPELALKYIRNILAQYRKDGLSSQRYERRSQTGVGSDILAGICTSVTALYSDIYGIRPKWNRMGLEPHMLPELYGTSFRYTHRGTDYDVTLAKDRHTLSTDRFTASSDGAFGVDYADGTLRVFPGNSDRGIVLGVKPLGGSALVLSLEKNTGRTALAWSIDGKGRYEIGFSGLEPGGRYVLALPGDKKTFTASADGCATMSVDMRRAGRLSLQTAQ